MSRWLLFTKKEADGLDRIKIWWLKKHGYLNEWKSGGIEWSCGWSNAKNSIGITASTMENYEHIRLRYTKKYLNGEKRDFDYRIQVTTTSCYFGGKRYWFVCPLSHNDIPCGKRIGVLYRIGDYFGCRHCHNLTYSSRNSKYGAITSLQKLENLEKEIKRKFYKGNLTRKYKQLLKKEQRNYFAFASLL